MSTALLVIDVQQALCSGPYQAFDARALVRRINEVIQRARLAKLLVVMVQHEEPDGPFQYGAEGWQLDPELQAQADDLSIRKTTPDSFHNTRLLAELQARGITHLVICGMQTEFCVDTTTRRALALGFPVTLVSDGHSTLDNAVLSAAQIIAHHNETLSKMESFGTRARLLPAAQVNFEG